MSEAGRVDLSSVLVDLAGTDTGMASLLEA